MGTEVTTITTKNQSVQGLLKAPAVRAKFDEVLGKRSPAFISSIITAVNATPALRECNPMSVVSAASIAAAIDLPINPSLGFAHIVPFKGVAQFQIGWKGFVQLAMRTGQYKTMNAAKVFDGQLKRHDPFTGEMEFDASVVSEKVIGYVLYFKLLNGYEKYFYMTREECLSHAKLYSASFRKGFGVWVENFDAMALKTVVKLGLSKYGVLSIEMQTAMETDQAVISEDGKHNYVDSTATEVPPAQATTPIEALNKKIRQKKAEEKTQNESIAESEGTEADPAAEAAAGNNDSSDEVHF